MRKALVIAAAMLISCDSIAKAEDAVGAFLKPPDVALFICAQTHSSSGFEAWKKCAASGKEKASAAYKVASASLTGKSAKSALKEYYIFLLTAFDATEPGPGERAVQYDERQSNNKQRLLELSNRVAVELE